MVCEVRKSGIDIVGNIPWGTHFCQFYQTKEDLLDILIPYFKAGLENNEACVWITSEPLNAQEAEKSLRNAMSNLDLYLTNGQMEILSHDNWYLEDGVFSSARVLSGWLEKLHQAQVRGYDGLRTTGNPFWLKKKDWKSFTDYEAVANTIIHSYPMIALCCYNLNKLNAAEATDVIRNHQHVLSRQEDKWEAIKKDGNGNGNTPAKVVEKRRKKDKLSQSPMLTVSEAAEFLGLHVNTVRRWSETGVLKSCRLGTLGHRRFLRDDLERFLEQQ